MRRTLSAVAMLVPLVFAAGVPPRAALAATSLDGGIQDLTRQIVPQVQRLGKKRVAVVDFAQLDGHVSNLGRYIAEELSAGLVIADAGLRVVDRQHLARIIAEQKLSVTGVTEPGSVQKLGQLAGADVLVTGSIVGLDDRVRITAKVVSTATAEIVGAAETTIPNDRDVQGLAPSLPPSPVASAPSYVAPAPRRAGATLADLRFTAAEPDAFDFTYVSKPMKVGDRVLHGGLIVYPSDGHAHVTYDLGGLYQTLTVEIGVPDSTPEGVQVVFRAFVDGRDAFPARVLRAGDSPVPVTIDVNGAHTLMLDVEAGGAPEQAQAVVAALWGEPHLSSRR